MDLKIKTYADGNVTIHKPRVSTKCFQQIQGVDYTNTFFLVVMLKYVQILLANCRPFRLLNMVDECQSGFPKWNLIKDVHMIQPEGSVSPKDAGKVWEL
jgi:hypothetical protein